MTISNLAFHGAAGKRAFMKGVVEGLMDLKKGREVSLGDVKKRFGLK